MTIRILHNALESGNSCLFDTEKQCYYELPDTRDKIALKPVNQGALQSYKSGGKYVWFDYFETIREFLESDKTMAIVLFFCTERKTVGKRYDVTLITQSENIVFRSFEKISIGWLNNQSNIRDASAPRVGIEICKPNSAYMFYLVKEPDALNGVRVKSVIKLENKN